jgi:hypothetical protein
VAAGDQPIVGSISMAVGATVRLSVVATAEDGSRILSLPTVSWQSNTSSVSVDANGVIRGMSAGVGFVKVSAQLSGRVLSDSVVVAVSQLL